MTTFKKNLSQNFLIDKNIKEKLINQINIKKNDIIIEIGAGEGSISSDISTLSKASHFIEIDKTFIHSLEKNTNTTKSNIHNDDILKFNLKDIIKKYKKIRIVGNLPYKIATKILLTLINFKQNIIDMHFIIQKEIAEKITIKCENKKYGKLSIMLQHNFEIAKIFDIKPHSFYPVPKVMSSLILIKPKKYIENLNNKILFNDILTKAFNNRRKKIYKSIKEIKNLNIKIDLNKRPNNMSINEFIEIYKTITNQKTEDYNKS